MKRKPKKAAKKATRKAKAAVPRSAQTIKLIRSPKEGEVRGQSAVICAVLERHHGKMVVSDLIKALTGRIKTRNVLGMADVYAMNRPGLIAKGLVEVKS
jgi:hypothetical protein